MIELLTIGAIMAGEIVFFVIVGWNWCKMHDQD
jgi:hypothetical protein